MRLVFMGTPDFAVPFLESLHARHRVTLVITQPDRPKGRGMKLAAPPVKEKALALGLPVAQPVSLKTPEFHEMIRAQAADLLVVVAFRILPASLFPLARFGAVNVHGSLLPRYRGAAPIQWAVANGEKETGVTVFRLDAEIDHGEILARAKTPIGPDETAGDLFARLRELGRDALLRAIDDLEAGRARPEPQNHEAATPAPKLRKEDGRLDFSLPAASLHDRVRAFQPYPVCYAVQAGTGRALRVHATRPVAEPPGPAGAAGGPTAAAEAADRAIATPEGGARPRTASAAPGEVRIGSDRFPYVRAGEGWLQLREVQWEGKPKVSGPDFVNGLQPAERESLRLE
jgi:methionyl-tRNA formyltransferase